MPTSAMGSVMNVQYALQGLSVSGWAAGVLLRWVVVPGNHESMLAGICCGKQRIAVFFLNFIFKQERALIWCAFGATAIAVTVASFESIKFKNISNIGNDQHVQR